MPMRAWKIRSCFGGLIEKLLCSYQRMQYIQTSSALPVRERSLTNIISEDWLRLSEDVCPCQRVEGISKTAVPVRGQDCTCAISEG